MSNTKTPISELGLHRQAYNALREQGICTIEILADCEEAELRRIPNVGDAVIAKMQRALSDRGMHFYGNGEDTYIPERKRQSSRTTTEGTAA
jgi:DNA-directed RNA polymerase alpha subunit